MTDTYMITYRAMRDQCQRELDGMEGHRQALQATIAGLDRLINDGSQMDLGEELGAPTVMTNGSKAPAIPPDFFKGKTPTQAYRDFVRLWGEDHSVPKIRDALVQGGIGKSKSELLPALHSVVRRERLKEEKNSKARRMLTMKDLADALAKEKRMQKAG